MTMEERPEREGEMPDINASATGEMVPAEISPPTVPRGVSEDEAQRVQSRAIELVKRLEDADGSNEMELLDGIANVGIQAQRDAAGQLNLLKMRIGTFLNQGGTSAEIANGLRDLRMTLAQINPHEMTQPGIGHRALGVLPGFKGRTNPMVRVLKQIALRYEPVSRQVTHIETNLRDGQALLVRDNVELRKLYEDVEAQQPPIQRNAYLGELLIQHLDGELLIQHLDRLLARIDDPVRRDRIQDALHNVVTRVQDLRAMEEVHVQYFVSIEMSRQNNNRLGQSVERTLTLVTNVVTVGLAIQSALIRQQGVRKATERTREFLGDLITANAKLIRQHTQEVGDLLNSPVIAMEKIAQAHNDLVEALNIASQLRQEGIEAGRDNIAKLTQMAESLGQRVSGVPQEGETRPGTVEA